MSFNSRLDSKYAEFSKKKFAFGIPLLMSASLLTYVTYQFQCVFYPSYYPLDAESFLGIIFQYSFRVWLVYENAICYLFMFRVYISNPGYIPSWLKHPKTDEGLAPCNVLRIYNMRTWMANGIYSYDEFADEN